MLPKIQLKWDPPVSRRLHNSVAVAWGILGVTILGSLLITEYSNIPKELYITIFGHKVQGYGPRLLVSLKKNKQSFNHTVRLIFIKQEQIITTAMILFHNSLTVYVLIS